MNRDRAANRLRSFFSKPFQDAKPFSLFLFIFPLLALIVGVFIKPWRLDASDFILIAWNPGRELLATGSVHADYPYPLWTVAAMLPFSVWEPPIAMTLWFACNLLMLSASLAILLTLFDWKISPALLGFLIPLSALFLPVLSSLWLGQLTIFSLFILVLTVWFFQREQWTWLGMALGLSFIKPQVMILLVGLILTWALYRRRWRVWTGFGAVMLLLVLISLPFVSNAGQLIGGGISRHLGTFLQWTSTIWGLALELGLSWLAPAAVSSALAAWLGWLCLPFLREERTPANRRLFLFSAVVLVNLIILPYSWMHNLALLLLPAAYCLSLILKISGRMRVLLPTLLFLITHPLMTALFLVFGISRHTQAYQVIPALLLLPLMVYLEDRANPAA